MITASDVAKLKELRRQAMTECALGVFSLRPPHAQTDRYNDWYIMVNKMHDAIYSSEYLSDYSALFIHVAVNGHDHD